jgi:toxin ParE1/3/4
MMKRYSVIFSHSAEIDIYESFEWGCREWGDEIAIKWAIELKSSVETLLKTFPKSQPVAPESRDLLFEIRQLIVGRYRVLYTINEDSVQILHVRGAFVGDNEND